MRTARESEIRCAAQRPQFPVCSWCKTRCAWLLFRQLDLMLVCLYTGTQTDVATNTPFDNYWSCRGSHGARDAAAPARAIKQNCRRGLGRASGRSDEENLSRRVRRLEDRARV